MIRDIDTFQLHTDICALWFSLVIANLTLLSLELFRRTATRMEDPLEALRSLVVTPQIPLGTIGPVASWEVYDLSRLPGDRRAINSRVLKYTRLTKNLTSLMRSVLTLYLDERFRRSFVPAIESLASRLTWIMLYFYGAMSHYSSWIFGQTKVSSVAQRDGPDWIEFLYALGQFFFILANLPGRWLAQGTDHVIDDTGQQQIIPAEAPLELVAQICLDVVAVSHLRDPGKTMLSWSPNSPEIVSRCRSGHSTAARWIEQLPG